MRSRRRPSTKPPTVQGVIYLLHFPAPYVHAKHYCGWTSRESLRARMAEHLAGRGSPLVYVAAQANGITTVEALEACIRHASAATSLPAA